MSVNPLDLQTNFMNINNISKKEVLSREQEILKQEHIADNIKRNMDKNLEDVPVTQKNEAIEHIDDYKDKNKKGEKNKKQNDKKSEEKQNKEQENDSIIENNFDSNNGIGKNINIIG